MRTASTGLENTLDGFMRGLCRLGLPQWHGADALVAGGGGGGGGGGQGGSTAALGWNHVGEIQLWSENFLVEWAFERPRCTVDPPGIILVLVWES